MLRKKVTYTDFNGITRTEEFLFNLTQAEVVILDLNNSLTDNVQGLLTAKNTKDVVRLFTEIIKTAYGEKSPDGRNFVKNDTILANFVSSAAYSEIFMELATNPESQLAFLKGIMPFEIDEAKLQQQIAELKEKN